MQKDEGNQQSNIEIALPIVSTIAARAVSDIPGVVELRSGIGEEFTRLVSRESQAHGVKVVQEEEQEVTLEVHLVAEYKTSLLKLSKQVSDRVKREVEAITEIKVKSVGVFIEDIVLPKGKKKSKS